MRWGAVRAMVRSGDPLATLRALPAGLTAVRVAAVGAGVRSGVLAELRRGAASTDALSRSLDVRAPDVLAALLRVLAAAKVVRGDDTRWRLTPRGRRIVDDRLVSATYEAVGDWHTALYRDLGQQLHGGSGRRDTTDRATSIAAVAGGMDPFVLAELDAVVREHAPSRVLDVGCGLGTHLAHVLTRAPAATGVGVESDPATAALATGTLAEAGTAGRARVVVGDVREVLADLPADERFDLVTLANVVYYLPEGARPGLVEACATRLSDQGRLVVVSTARAGDLWSRHFDLLLRAQDGAMTLPTAEQLRALVAGAGLRAGPARTLVPGGSLVAVVGRP